MSWWEDRNERWKREREDRDAKLRSQGFRIVSCVAYYYPATGDRPMCTWSGETETIVITDVQPEHLQYGIGCVLVSPTSEVIENPADPVVLARSKNGVVLTVFKGKRPS